MMNFSHTPTLRTMFLDTGLEQEYCEGTAHSRAHRQQIFFTLVPPWIPALTNIDLRELRLWSDKNIGEDEICLCRGIFLTRDEVAKDTNLCPRITIFEITSTRHNVDVDVVA